MDTDLYTTPAFYPLDAP